MYLYARDLPVLSVEESTLPQMNKNKSHLATLEDENVNPELSKVIDNRELEGFTPLV